MVENNEEGEEDALVNSDGSKDPSEEEIKCQGCYAVSLRYFLRDIP